MNKKETGLIQVFTGAGKGKTTAALGTVLRAAGHGLKISVIFFIKGHSEQGENKTLAKLPGVKVTSFGLRHFIHKSESINPEEKAQAEAALAKAREDIKGGKYDVVVLDEINCACFFNLLKPETVVQMLKEKPPKVEVILTGRNAPPEIINAADLVTEMMNIKHPFEKGIKARKGIEY